MLSKDEAILLQRISDSGGALNTDQIRPYEAETMMLLCSRACVQRVGVLNLTRYTLTDAGRIALAEYTQAQKDLQKHRADDAADKERDRLEANARDRLNRRSNVICAILGALVGSLVTFALDHLDVILTLFQSPKQ